MMLKEYYPKLTDQSDSLAHQGYKKCTAMIELAFWVPRSKFRADVGKPSHTRLIIHVIALQLSSHGGLSQVEDRRIGTLAMRLLPYMLGKSPLPSHREWDTPEDGMDEVGIFESKAGDRF